MKHLAFAVALFSLTTCAQAGEATSAYTGIDLKKCKIVEKGDEYAYAGTWRCQGYGGVDVFISSGDDRESAAFGRAKANNCAGLKTFNGFNGVGKTVEWRLRDGKPFAAILRWTVSIDPEDSTKTATWLVVSKLEAKDACHMHYVNGAFPKANDVARKVADEKAGSFVCETGVPTFDSTIGPPGITMESCSAMARE